MQRKSRIFTNAELEVIAQKEAGKYKDTNGLFAGRIKPKVKELLKEWVPKKKKLEKLIK